jgi:glucose-6-phosphate dehydrogenase assembly protein OpcA
VAAAVIRLDDTTGNAVAAEIASQRHRMGSPAVGMVLTLLVLSDEESQADAVQAATAAAREHPMRIIVLIPRPGRVDPRLDAEISVGGDDGPGEVAVLRLRGELAGHAGSVAIPLLLPDTPVVAWWPAAAPAVLADDPIGSHAQRRITDAAAVDDPLGALLTRQDGYRAGDTDLAWTRLTPWRSMLAAALDQPPGRITATEVSVMEGSPSGPLLASWLRERLGVPCTLNYDEGPGITGVRFVTDDGDISLTRPDGRVAQLSRPGQPSSTVALPRRTLAELLAEELRRLDPDETYAAALAGVGKGAGSIPLQKPAARTGAKAVAKKPAARRKAGT